jgi:AraC-like DNA-binding protein
MRQSTVSIGRRFRSLFPKERFRDLWETDAGLAFIQLHRIADGLWESPGSKPTGLYHVVVHASRPVRRGLSEILVPAKARRVIDYIESNLACDLQLVELSTVAGISRSHFARAFRNTIGMAPHTFVLQRRLARAVELLTPRTRLVREVAARCGFADQAHLTRAFKA